MPNQRVNKLKSLFQRLHLQTKVAVILFLVLFALIYQYRLTFHHKIHPDSRYDIGLALQPFANQGYVFVSDEAGLIPFYSKWTSIDAGGSMINGLLITRESPQTTYHR